MHLDAQSENLSLKKERDRALRELRNLQNKEGIRVGVSIKGYYYSANNSPQELTHSRKLEYEIESSKELKRIFVKQDDDFNGCTPSAEYEEYR